MVVASRARSCGLRVDLLISLLGIAVMASTLLMLHGWQLSTLDTKHKRPVPDRDFLSRPVLRRLSAVDYNLSAPVAPNRSEVQPDGGDEVPTAGRNKSTGTQMLGNVSAAAQAASKAPATASDSPTPAKCGEPQRPSKSVAPMCMNGQVLPSVFLIGTNKAGSTNLFSSLVTAFPLLRPGAQGSDGTEEATRAWDRDMHKHWDWKEKMYWSRHYNRGLPWYLSYYPQCPSGPGPTEAWQKQAQQAHTLVERQSRASPSLAKPPVNRFNTSSPHPRLANATRNSSRRARSVAMAKAKNVSRPLFAAMGKAKNMSRPMIANKTGPSNRNSRRSPRVMPTAIGEISILNTTAEHHWIGLDASADLLWHADAPGRIASVYGPEAKRKLKFIVLMKDPVQIFHSHVYMIMRQQNKQQNSKNFEEIALREIHGSQQEECASMFRRNGTLSQMSCDKHGSQSLRHAAHAPMLRNWLQHFEPDQFILVSSEEYFKRPHTTLEALADALDLPACLPEDGGLGRAASTSGAETRRNNVGKHPKLKQENPALLSQLTAFYRPLVDQLRELLDTHSGPNGFRTIGEMQWLQSYA